MARLSSHRYGTLQDRYGYGYNKYIKWNTHHHTRLPPQERFRAVTPTYYKGAHGVIMVYDVTRPETFEALPKWLTEVREHAPQALVIGMVGIVYVTCISKRAVPCACPCRVLPASQRPSFTYSMWQQIRLDTYTGSE